MSCIIEEVLKQIFGFDTIRDAWLSIEKTYASRFRA